jgi:fucose permease
MAAKWHLRDQQSGRLFLLAWMSSSLGALLVRGSLRRVLVVGTGAIAVGSTALAFCPGWSAAVWMMLYGLGLGITMTSISLIRQAQAKHSGLELLRLNLLWATGAFACPSLTIRSQRTGEIAPVLCTMAFLFAAVAIWGLVERSLTAEATGPRHESLHPTLDTIPFLLIVLTVLITGIEASAGAWLATYAKRDGGGIGGIVGLPTCFWAGLLGSRLLWSLRQSSAWHHRIVRGSIALIASSWIAISFVEGRAGLLAAGFCLGFGVGPIYPLLLAWALRFRRSGFIFFMAGVGSAMLPWLTGVVSERWHSLRIGLVVPLTASAVMLCASIVLPLSNWSRRDAGLAEIR